MNDTSGAAASPDALRERTRTLLAQGKRHEAIQAARELLASAGGLRTWRFLAKLAADATTEGADLKPLRVALLSSFSIEFAQDAMCAFGLANGLRIEIYRAGFGALRQEILDPSSGLYAFAPDVVILAVDGADWVPAAYADFDVQAAAFDAHVDAFAAELTALCQALRARSPARLIVHGFAPPQWLALGVLDARHAGSQKRFVHALNDAMRKVADNVAEVHLLDYEALVARHGAEHWHDQRMRLYARAPIAQTMLGHLAGETMRFLRAFTGMNRKCVVVDLDNTLWGGVIGEDGIAGIKLGPEYPGSAFVEFQRALLALHRRGILLAVASKNNPADVEQVFAEHRGMVLKPEHFAATQIHWEPKSASLERIAARLNIGLEHIVFVDDNPTECAQVRGALPMVTVIQLPARPEDYVRALLQDGWFDSVSATAEDARRGALYQQRAQAEEVRAAAGSLEDFYRDLDMEIDIAPVNAQTLARTAQLTQKTNQLNLTTRRYSEAQVAQRMDDPRWHVLAVSVRDRFGDNGIVGVMMVREEADRLDVDTLLLSCRVIGRTVETAMLAHLCGIAARAGLRAITACLIPTDKNHPVRGMLPEHGFARVREDADGTTHWQLEIAEHPVESPPWFRVAQAHSAIAT